MARGVGTGPGRGVLTGAPELSEPIPGSPDVNIPDFPSAPERTGIGRRVGKTASGDTQDRFMTNQLNETPKGHRVKQVRPVHQGGSFSFRKQKPDPRKTKSQRFSFGDI